VLGYLLQSKGERDVRPKRDILLKLFGATEPSKLPLSRDEIGRFALDLHLRETRLNEYQQSVMGQLDGPELGKRLMFIDRLRKLYKRAHDRLKTFYGEGDMPAFVEGEPMPPIEPLMTPPPAAAPQTPPPQQQQADEPRMKRSKSGLLLPPGYEP
jgi:hypothetical protein